MSVEGQKTDFHFRKIIVAVHGIGEQLRNDTVRSVARQVSLFTGPKPPALPLGFFHSARTGKVSVRALPAGPTDLGFAEFYWADIPRGVVKDGDTLEDTKAWGASVASRAHNLYEQARNAEPGAARLPELDFDHAASVLEEIVEAVAVLDRVLFIFDKMGIFKFDVAALLLNYLGDVQLVTEFEDRRNEILTRFHEHMTDVVANLAQDSKEPPALYLVAHSEGSVVSLLALLQGLCRGPGGPAQLAWVDSVRGFMTIGSPIDKHMALWPELWRGFQLPTTAQHPIDWRNYYDYGDPIGFKLDIARDFIQGSNAFAFGRDVSSDGKPSSDAEGHDIGYANSWVPGKAHVDYWRDRDVFGHFLANVVKLKSAGAKTHSAPKNSRLRGAVSSAIPYLSALVFQWVALFLFLKATSASASHEDSWLEVAQRLGTSVLLLGLLLAGTTAAARIPHLMRVPPVWTGWQGLKWYAIVLAIFAFPAALTWFCLPSSWDNAFPPALIRWVGSGLRNPGASLLITGAAVVAVSGQVVPRRDRLGRHLLVASGMTLVSALVVYRFFWPDQIPWCAPSAQPPPVWPLILGGAAFLYLWWLSILLFDLAFVWQRYVRQSVANETLRNWHRRYSASRDAVGPK
jgi:hypothetical protein